jgi:hypothetical protein
MMIGISPAFPRGIARVAELHGGAAFDAVAFGLAFGSIALVIVASLALPVLRASSTRGGRVETASVSRPSLIGRAVTTMGLSPVAVSGARLALEPGAGRTSVPVRSTIAASVLSVVAIVAASTFGSSLRHMIDTPPLWGKNWHTSYGFEDEQGPAKNLATARAHPDVVAAEIGSNGIPMRIDNFTTNALLLDSGWSVTTPLIEGAYPRDDEIVVGPRTLRAIGKEVGDTVKVAPPGLTPQRLRISGVGVVPPMSETMQLGQGLLMPYTAADELEGAPPPDELFVRFKEGIDPAVARERLRAQLVDPSDDFSTTSPADLINLGRIDTLPIALAGVLGVLAGAIVAHMLLTSISRRRRDLAILKTVGFERKQVRRTVAWQASLLVVVSLIVALPLGIAGGRWLWSLLAGQLGVVPRPVVDVRWIAAIIPAALALANVVGIVPARRAARTAPAVVLRTE